MAVQGVGVSDTAEVLLLRGRCILPRRIASPSIASRKAPGMSRIHSFVAAIATLITGQPPATTSLDSRPRARPLLTCFM